jgi:hypothetical protein
VELGDHHVTLLDGDRMEPIHRFKSRFALHGGPKYSASGRFVYFASRDGWISKYDIYNLKLVAEIRAGINTRNLAVSADGRYVMVANYLPHSLVLLDATPVSVPFIPHRRATVLSPHSRTSRRSGKSPMMMTRPLVSMAGCTITAKIPARTASRSRSRYGESGSMTTWMISFSTRTMSH